MTKEIATLGIEVKTDGVKSGTEALDNLSRAGEKAEKATKGVSDASTKASAQIAAMAQKAQSAGTSFKPLDGVPSGLAKVATEARNASAGVTEMVNAMLRANQESGSRGLANSAGLLSKGISAVGGVAGIAAASLVVYESALVGIALHSAHTLDSVGKLAQTIGQSVESVSELRHAFMMAGATQEQMTDLMGSLTSRAESASHGVGLAADAYKAMGISVTNSNGKLKDGRTLLEEVADKISGYRDSAAKTVLVQDALGSGWARMIPLLNGGAAGLREAATEARQLGVVFDEKLTKQAADFNDNMIRIKAAAEGARISIGNELLPTLARLSEEFVQGIKHSDGFWDSLMRYGMTNPFTSTQEKLAALRKEASDLEDTMSRGRGKEGDDERLRRLNQEIGYYDTLIKKKAAASTDGGGSVKTDAPAISPKSKTEKVSDFQRLIQSINEKISIETLDLQTTEKLTAAEKEFSKYQADLTSGRLKLTAAEKTVAGAYWETYLARAKANQEEKSFQSVIDQQTEANRKQHIGMLANIAAAEQQAEIYGLSASQISVIEQARLADAIATARQNGVSGEQIQYLQDELELRGKLTDALIKVDKKKMEIDGAKNDLTEMDIFAEAAAKNIQSSMADFLFDPFENGVKGMADSFGKALQRMIANAAAAQIARAMFGDILGTQPGRTPSGDNGWIGAAINIASAYFGGGTSQSASQAAVGADINSAGLGGFANGGVFGDGEVLTQPTMFRFASGGSFRTGVAGEAGYEGALPLKRMGNGKLGVYMEGAGSQPITINQTFNGSSGSDKAQVGRSAAAGARSVLGAWNGARRYG